MPPKSRERQLELQREWYQRNKASERARLQADKIAIAAAVRAAKNHPCMDCGGKFHHAAMDFDHVRGEKRFLLSRAHTLGVGKDRLEEEIAKCDVVCSNCHRIRTFERQSAVGSFNG